MAIIGSAKLQTDPPRRTGDQRRDGVRVYNATYVVESDDKRDGPQTILTAPGLPKFPSTYALGNDIDNQAQLLSLVPTETASKCIWRVDAVWQTPDQLQQTDAAGNPTDDPLKETPTLEVRTQNREGPIHLANFKGPVLNNVATVINFQGKPIGKNLLVPGDWPDRTFRHPFLEVGDLSTLINSAGEEYSNPPSREEADITFRYTRNFQTFNQFDITEHINTVNYDGFWMSGFGFEMFFQVNTARIIRIDASLQFKPAGSFLAWQNNVGPNGERIVVNVENVNAYWKVSYEIVWRSTLFGGWDIRILDKGKSTLAKPGFDDRRGNKIPADQWKEKTKATQEQTDIITQPPGGEKLLGGDGLPLYEDDISINDKIHASITQDPVLHNWQIYASTIMQPLFPTLEQLLAELDEP